mmetsp:Transcript_34943/g.88897  ORF Transcript_34943/g.88897 Transcript_34943/m.88897 type:complete len:202 (-) Transcript_34943:823-1428(-)
MFTDSSILRSVRGGVRDLHRGAVEKIAACARDGLKGRGCRCRSWQSGRQNKCGRGCRRGRNCRCRRGRGRCSTRTDSLAVVEPLDAQVAQPLAGHEQVVSFRNDREPSLRDHALDGFDRIVPGFGTYIHGMAHVQTVGNTCVESIGAAGHDPRRATDLLDRRRITMLDLDDRVGEPLLHVPQLLLVGGRGAVDQAAHLVPN